MNLLEEKDILFRLGQFFAPKFLGSDGNFHRSFFKVFSRNHLPISGYAGLMYKSVGRGAVIICLEESEDVPLRFFGVSTILENKKYLPGDTLDFVQIYDPKVQAVIVLQNKELDSRVYLLTMPVPPEEAAKDVRLDEFLT